MNNTEDIPEPAWWESNRAVLGGYLLSVSVHALLLLLLALIAFPLKPQDLTKYLTIRTQVTENERLETLDNLEVTPPKLNDGTLNDLASLDLATNMVAEQPNALSIDVKQQTLQYQIEADEFLGKPQKFGEFSGRTEEARTLLANAFGGSASTEAAVAGGLKWLAAHQKKDGSWNFNHTTDQCGEDCLNPGNMNRETVGATGMALLCFVGAGHTHLTGSYQPQVSKALDFLKKEFLKEEATGEMRQIKTGNSGMYTQGIVTIAICELYALSKDRDVGRMAQKCIDYIVAVQHPENGGWRYQPDAEVGDTSVVGWHVMALTSARIAHLTVPNKSRVLARRFLTSVQLEEGAFYGYTNPEKRAATTAIGLLCRMYEGWGPDEPQMHVGVQYLSALGPARDDMYYNYYATQVMHQWGGNDWDKWNRVMREQLLTTQSKEGHAAGSWAPRDRHGTGPGGRHYMTCLAVLTLEVYYRHLPIYQRRNTKAEL